MSGWTMKSIVSLMRTLLMSSCPWAEFFNAMLISQTSCRVGGSRFSSGEYWPLIMIQGFISDSLMLDASSGPILTKSR